MIKLGNAAKDFAYVAGVAAVGSNHRSNAVGKDSTAIFSKLSVVTVGSKKHFISISTQYLSNFEKVDLLRFILWADFKIGWFINCFTISIIRVIYTSYYLVSNIAQANIFS